MEKKEKTPETKPAPTGVGVEPLVIHLSDALNRICLCTDGQLRRLLKFDDDLGYYEVPISDTVWQKLSGTWRRQCDQLFVGGKLIG